MTKIHDRMTSSPERCVLMFHRIVEACERDHDVSWPSFLHVLDIIQDAVTTELDLNPSGGKAVVLTFDDGTFDHAAAGSALAARQLPGIFFVPAGLLGSGGFLTEAQICDLHAEGHVIGSHGFHNIRFDNLTPSELHQEVRGSKDRLEDVLGTAVAYLAPPGGSNHTLLVKELKESGFSAARSVRWGIHNRDADRWRIPCIPVTELTVSRGWVKRVLTRWSLPWTMRAVWGAKEFLPPDARSTVRAWTHRGSRR